MKINTKIEEIMFEDLKKKFPDHNYNLDFYQEIMKNPSVNALLELAHYQISESFGILINSYGWRFRNSINPENLKEIEAQEEREDKIFGEFNKFFDFYYTYRDYSVEYKNCTFDEYLEKRTRIL